MSLRNFMAAVALAGVFTAASAQAGADGKPISQADRVEAYNVNTYYIDFRGGEYAEVAIVGDGDTDLDLFVYDKYGRLVGSGESYSDIEVVGWTPRRTGRFRVEVHNLGSVYNRFGLGSN